MRALALALTVLLAAAPAAAQTADAYDQAVQARLGGDPGRAAELLAPVVAGDPANADAWLQLGLAQLALGRLDQAESSFRRVLSLAPDYADARIGLARVAQRRGDRAAARAELAAIPAGNAEAEALGRSLAGGGGGAARLRIDADLRYSAVERQSDWREGALQIVYAVTPATRIGGLVDIAHRFGRTDVFAELSAEHQFAPGTRIYGGVGATPSADFRPEWQLSAGGAVRANGGSNPTDLTLDLRAADYPSGDIQTVNPGIEQYLADGRAWITARWINVFDEDGDHRGGWLARADAMASDRLRLFAGASDAPDTSEGVVVRTFALFGGFAADLDDRHSLRLSATHEDRDSGSDRFEIAAGIGFRL